MKKVDLYPVECYEFESNHKWQWIEKIRELDLKETGTGTLNTGPELHKNEKFKPIVDFINECLGKIRLHYNYDCSGFKITSMWANYYRPGTDQHAHRHANSYYSGVLYLSGGAPTVFYDPLAQRYQAQFDLFTLPKSTVDGFDKNGPRFEKSEAEAGKMIVFPSWLVHSTAIAQEDRYSIAFNAMPYGKINSKWDSVLNIEVL